MTLDAAWALSWMRLAAADLADAKELLTELDRQIGDGDHGISINKGFQVLLTQLPEAPAFVGDVLGQAAITLITEMGGAAGPLYGSAFLRAAKATATTEVAGVDDIIVILAAALEGIQKRGGAARGEKTMVDA
ncbi:MAG: DAK2 domain-containing protein, partial [Promicromonosporaceae bacterium]|nr:DAK2 domain-containing protein [Promicromonosporaceae bacterium]